MPTVLIIDRFTFYFYANEGTEPPHVHVDAAENTAKYWLDPIELQANRGFRSGERKEIEQILQDNRAMLLRKWDEFFSNSSADRT
jgi:hypothetical protein